MLWFIKKPIELIPCQQPAIAELGDELFFFQLIQIACQRPGLRILRQAQGITNALLLNGKNRLSIFYRRIRLQANAFEETLEHYCLQNRSGW